MQGSIIQRVQRFDRAREGLPGEHWLVLAAGIAVWLASRRHPSLAVRIAGSVAGTAAVARAASGRKVPGKILEWLPYAKGRS